MRRRSKRRSASIITLVVLLAVLVGVGIWAYPLVIEELTAPAVDAPVADDSQPAAPDPHEGLEDIKVLLNQRLSVDLGTPARAPQGRGDPFAQVTTRVPDLPPGYEEPDDDDSVIDDEDPGDPLEGSFEISVRTLDRCWLEVWVDGSRQIRTNVEAGTELSWRANDEILLEQVGREWALVISVNGEDKGLAENIARNLEGQTRPLSTDDGYIEVSLESRYASRVLVGLAFRRPGFAQ